MSNHESYMSFSQIEAEFGVKATTLKGWKSTGKYGFDKIVVKLGRKPLVKRSDLIRFIENGKDASHV